MQIQKNLKLWKTIFQVNVNEKNDLLFMTRKNLIYRK